MIVLIIAVVVVGLYWWRRTSKEKSRERRITRGREQKEKTLEASRDLLKSLRQVEKLPHYPPHTDGHRPGAVTFYTIVRGDAAKVAAVVSHKCSSYEETSGRHRDEDTIGAARAIADMLKAQSDCCSFQWGMNTVEYRLHRDQSDEFMFVEITERLR
jgi:hypothetical protein